MYMQSPNQVKQKKEDVFYSNRFPLFVKALEKNPNLRIEMVTGKQEPWLNMVMPFAFFTYGRFQKQVSCFLYGKYEHDNACLPAFRRSEKSRLLLAIERQKQMAAEQRVIRERTDKSRKTIDLDLEDDI